jgi:hypothetical protein
MWLGVFHSVVLHPKRGKEVPNFAKRDKEVSAKLLEWFSLIQYLLCSYEITDVDVSFTLKKTKILAFPSLFSHG